MTFRSVMALRPAEKSMSMSTSRHCPVVETGDGEAPAIRREFHVLGSAGRCDGAPHGVGGREGELRVQAGVQVRSTPFMQQA